MESKQKEVWFWMYCKHCKHYAINNDNEHDIYAEPCDSCLGDSYNWDSHKPTKYEWDGKGKEPIYDSTEERKIWHDNGEVVADEPIEDQPSGE